MKHLKDIQDIIYKVIDGLGIKISQVSVKPTKDHNKLAIYFNRKLELYLVHCNYISYELYDPYTGKMVAKTYLIGSLFIKYFTNKIKGGD